MRCKVGDLALIIRSLAGNEGKVVTCLEFIGIAPGAVRHGGETLLLHTDGSGWWRVDRNLNMFQVNPVTYEGTITNDMAPYCRDDFMVPIGNISTPSEEVKDETLLSIVPV